MKRWTIGGLALIALIGVFVFFHHAPQPKDTQRFGSITLDATSYGQNVDQNVTFSHTTADGATILVVSTFVAGGGTAAVSGVTYNGTALAKAASASNGSGGEAGVWYLVNPPTGAHNVVVSGNAGVGTASGAAITLFGTDTTSPIGGTASLAQQTTATPFSSTLTVTGASGSYIVSSLGYTTTASDIMTPADTETAWRSSAIGNSAIGSNHHAGAGYVQHAGSNYSVSWNVPSTNSNKFLAAAEIKLPAAAPAVVPDQDVILFE